MIFFRRILNCCDETNQKNTSKEAAKRLKTKTERKPTTFKSTSDALSSILNGPKSMEKQKAEKEMTMLRRQRKFKW
jgi:hypothetical protein